MTAVPQLVDRFVRIRILFLVLASLIAVACGTSGSGGRVAATVEGNEILVSEIEALSAGEAAAVESEAFLGDLRNLIVLEVERTAAADLGVEAPTEEEIEAELSEIKAQVETEDQTFEEQLGDRSERFAELVAEASILQQRISEALGEDAEAPTEEEIQSAFDQRLASEATVCVRHILLETEEEAEQVISELESGADFAELAAERSIDPSAAENQGDLGCGPASEYVPEFATASLEAEIGEVVGPVESQFGQHVLIVDERETPTLEDLRGEITEQLTQAQASQAFTEWLLEALQEAEVEVAEEFGRWEVIDPATGQPNPRVVPPEE